MEKEIQKFVIVKDVVDICKEINLNEEVTFRFLVLKDLNTNQFYLLEHGYYDIGPYYIPEEKIENLLDILESENDEKIINFIYTQDYIPKFKSVVSDNTELNLDINNFYDKILEKEYVSGKNLRYSSIVV
jgi:hypothetical protein